MNCFMMQIGASFFAKERGRKSLFLSNLVLGIIAGAATAPFSLFVPILFLLSSFLFLIWSDFMSFQKHPYSAMAGFSMGYYTVALHWITFALHVDWASFYWVIPFALLGIPFVFTLYHLLFTWLFQWHKAQGLQKALRFIAMWLVVEYFKDFLFTGFPWATLGYIWAPNPIISQFAAIMGVSGLSLLTLLGVSALYMAVPRPQPLAYRKPFILGVTVFFLGVLVFGWLRLDQADSYKASGKWVRLVQPNITQLFKWDPAQRQANAQKLMRLSCGGRQVQAILWPESAWPYPAMTFEKNAALSRIIPNDTLLITGVTRFDPSKQIWNSIAVYDPQGNMIDFYDKSHLVPFGEYVPLRALLNTYFPSLNIKKLTAGMMDFSVGDDRHILSTRTLPPIKPLVCYEVIFPHEVAEATHNAEWLLNVTNDGWYLNSLGPYQHFEIARMRAIENGMPLVRVANTGISGIFNAFGQVQTKLDLGTEGGVDVVLPKALETRPPYARWVQDFLQWVFLALFLNGVFIRLKKFKKPIS